MRRISGAFQYRTPTAVRAGTPSPGTVGAVRRSWTIDDMCDRQMDAGIMATEEHDEEGRLFIDLLDWRRTRTVVSWSLAEAEHVLEVVDELPTGAEYLVRWHTVPRMRLEGDAVVVLAGTLGAAIGKHRCRLHDGEVIDTSDVFAGAGWLDKVGNGVARAVAPDLVEWRCRTWGSGEGNAAWEDFALFQVVATLFDLSSDSDFEGRDELLVYVPLDRFSAVARLIEELGEEPLEWPWLRRVDNDRRLAIAAETLELPLPQLQENSWLQQALGLT